MSTPISLSQQLPLNLVLHDGATDKFPRAHVFNQADAEVPGSPFSLAHVADGYYTNKTLTVVPGMTELTAVYIVYDDAGHTLESPFHTHEEDVFDIDAKYQPSASSTSQTYVALPDEIELPSAGTKHYRFVLYVFDVNGSPADADANVVNIHIETADGVQVLALQPITRDQQGVYFYIYVASAGDPEQPLFVEFSFARGGIPFLVGDVTEAIRERAVLETLQGRLTAVRAGLLDNLDAAVSSREAEAQAALRAAASDARFNSVDAQLAEIDLDVPDSLSTDVSAIKVEVLKIGTPATGTLGGAIAQVKADTVLIGAPAHGTLAGDDAFIEARLGAPVLATFSADIQEIAAETDKIGPSATGSITSDIQAVQAKLGTPVGASVSADVAQVEGSVLGVQALIGTPANGTVSADLVDIDAETDTLVLRLTAARASNLDNLDVPVSSRESTSDMQTKYNQLHADDVAILSAIGAIPNNTSFVGIVPEHISLPEAGSQGINFYAYFYEKQNGTPDDPDADMVTVTIRDEAGAVVLGPSPMTKDAVGRYHLPYNVNASDQERSLNVFFNYAFAAVNYEQARKTLVAEGDGDIDTLLARLTPSRATALDFLDVAVSSRSSTSAATANTASVLAATSALAASVATILARLGLPSSGSLAGDIVLLQTKVNMIGNPATGTLAGDIAQVKAETDTIATVDADVQTVLARLGSPALASVSADIQEIAADVDKIGPSSTGTLTSDIAQVLAAIGSPGALLTLVTAIQTALSSLTSTVGSPAVTVAADIAAVLAKLGAPATGTVGGALAQLKADVDASTLAIEGNIAALGTDIAAVAIDVDEIAVDVDAIGPSTFGTLTADIAAIEAKLGSPAFASVSGDIANLLTKVLLIPVNPELASDPRLANLDAPVSTRATPANLANAAQGLNIIELVGIVEVEGELVGIIDEAA